MLSPILLHSLDCVAKNCMNGGTQDPDTCDCVCPPEYTGPLCESKYLMTPYSQCVCVCVCLCGWAIGWAGHASA